MPPIKFTEVLSYSSEDPNHPVENLLNQDTFRKWKCSPGTSEKQAFVILKLENLTSINSLDIGNEGSALIEVLVSREGLTDYELLLVSSAFMSPSESRNGTDLNRVRMFGPDKLNKKVAEQKWDRLKVICTQPFNTKMQFGLSFITARTLGNDAGGSKVTKLGSFTLKVEDESDPIPVGFMFAKRNEKPALPSSTGPAAIRAASRESAAAITSPGILKRKDAPTDVGVHQPKKKTAGDISRGISIAKGPAADFLGRTPAEERPRVKDVKGNSKPEGRSKLKDNGGKEEKVKREKKENESKKSNSKPSSSKGATQSGAAGKKRKTKPFTALMHDVVFVMSGYQNPERSHIRDRAVEMGATYRSDWNPTCTHLICAFTNTPKYRQVKGKGRIVTSKWVTDSYKNKIRYPCRMYELENRKDVTESEEEIWADELLPKDPESTPNVSTPTKLAEDSDTDEDTNFSDNEDTDDEIQKVLERQQRTAGDDINNKETEKKKNYQEKNSKSPSKPDTARYAVESRRANDREELIKTESPDPPVSSTACEDSKVSSGLQDGSDDELYDDDTDIDDEFPDTSSLPLPRLGDYFKGRHFFLYGSMTEENKKMLKRYIVAFNGQVEDYMNEEVHFVISEDTWDENFEEALNDNPSLQFVKTQWIWQCCDKKKLVPHQPYLIVPKE